jgi:hypothetical protein
VGGVGSAPEMKISNLKTQVPTPKQGRGKSEKGKGRKRRRARICPLLFPFSAFPLRPNCLGFGAGF